MAFLTIYALFGDDIRLLAFTKSADDAFYTFTCVCIAFFVFELVIASIAKDDYIFGFFFWLDLIATISLLMDVG